MTTKQPPVKPDPGHVLCYFHWEDGTRAWTQVKKSEVKLDKYRTYYAPHGAKLYCTDLPPVDPTKMLYGEYGE